MLSVSILKRRRRYAGCGNELAFHVVTADKNIPSVELMAAGRIVHMDWRIYVYIWGIQGPVDEYLTTGFDGLMTSAFIVLLCGRIILLSVLSY
jgi:hypothetical protein